jgi:hypothetical protein
MVKETRERNLAEGKAQTLSTNQILVIWMKVEKGIAYSYELPNAVSPLDYLDI